MKYVYTFLAIIGILFFFYCIGSSDCLEDSNQIEENPPIVDNDNNNEDDKGNNNNPNPEIIPTKPEIPYIENYVVDNEELYIYELIYSDLSLKYETSCAYINLGYDNVDNEEINIYGLMYVDYEDAYVDSDDKTYYCSGFIAFPNQKSLNKLDTNYGYEIISEDAVYNEDYSFVYNYSTEDVHMHCILNNKYIKYDIIDNIIYYEEEEYVYGMGVDDSRGNVWNYDTNEYVYIITEQDYVPAIGSGLASVSNYEDILFEVNEILRLQESNLTYDEIETFVSESQDALYSYLLGLQEETFFGYETSQLIELSKTLDPMQHIKISVSSTGIQKIDFIEINKIPSLAEKALTTFVCVNAVVGGIVCEIIGHVYPPLKPILSPIAGASIAVGIECFMQVVVENTPVSEMDWVKVGLAATSGAIAGLVNNKLGAIKNVVIREGLDLVCDGVLGGTEFFVEALIDGKSFNEAIEAFGIGVVTSVVLSGMFKVAIKGITVVGSKIIKGVATVIDKIKDKTVKNIVDLGTDELGDRVAYKTAQEAVDALTNKVKTYADDLGQVYRVGDDLLPNSKYILNGYEYFTDGAGRIRKVSGTLYFSPNLGNKKTINDAISIIGKGDELSSDQRGHLIADRFNGDNKMGNLVAMNGNLNQGEFKKFENELADLVKEGKKVNVEIIIEYAEDSNRPDIFQVYYEVDDIPQPLREFLNQSYK